MEEGSWLATLSFLSLVSRLVALIDVLIPCCTLYIPLSHINGTLLPPTLQPQRVHVCTLNDICNLSTVAPNSLCTAAEPRPICGHVASSFYLDLQLHGLIEVTSAHNAEKPRLSCKGRHWIIDAVWHCFHPDPMQSSRDIVRIAWDRMGLPSLPPLEGGIP